MSYDKLMIVAHPDDETIFGGAQLIKESGWLVICVTNGDNKIRRKEFQRVMGKVHADYEIWNHPDQWGGDFDEEGLRADLAEVLARKSVQKVVTHSLAGEYGHTQHMALSKLVHEMVEAPIYVFDTSEKKLDPGLLMKKQKLLACYESQDIEWLQKYVEFESIKRVR